jgi:hypothetical protein
MCGRNNKRSTHMSEESKKICFEFLDQIANQSLSDWRFFQEKVHEMYCDYMNTRDDKEDEFPPLF